MLTIRTTTLLATIATTQAVDYFKASCTKVEAGTVFIDQFGNGKKTVVGPANNCLIVGSSIIKCTGCGSSADCKIYDHTANAPCTVASADQSAKSMITCDESIPGTAINLQKFVDDDDCSGTAIAIGDNAGDLRWPWGTAPGYISSTGCNLLGNVAGSDPMAYNTGKYVCNADGSLTLGQHANRFLCAAPVLPANRDATIPFSLPSDGGCYTLGAAETAVAALATNKNKICKVPADFNPKNAGGCVNSVTTKTETGGALAGLSIGSPDTCSALSTAASTELTDLAKTCCILNSGAAESFCTADKVPSKNRFLCKVPANWRGEGKAGKNGNTCDSLVEFYSLPVGDSTDPSAGALLNSRGSGIDFSTPYNCDNPTIPDKAVEMIDWLANPSQGCCGGGTDSDSTCADQSCIVNEVIVYGSMCRVLAPAPAPSNLEKDSSATSVAVAFGAIVAVACSVFAM